MSIKNQRNKPCWCGSGIKYKKCHLLRGQKSKVPVYTIHNDFKNSLKYKECKVPDKLQYECLNTIIKAHTISKSANLKNIARNGKVYGMQFSMLDIEGDSNPVKLELMHINQASTFYIFCSKHDKELFAPLEDNKFIFSSEQIFLLAYRIVAKALYMKEQQIKMFSKNVSVYDKGVNQLQQAYIQSMSHMFSDKESQSNDVARLKKVFDEDLLSKEYSNMKYYCILVDRIPEVMIAGIFIPDRDFDGNVIIDYIENPSIEYNAIQVSIINLNGRGVIVFSWNDRIESQECDVFIRSLDKLTHTDKIKAIACLFLKKTNENLYFSPSWYEGLDSNKKTYIDASYVVDEYIEHSNEDIENLLNSSMTLLPDFFNKLNREEQRRILNSIPTKDDDISDFEKYDLFDWKILEIKTNINELNLCMFDTKT